MYYSFLIHQKVCSQIKQVNYRFDKTQDKGLQIMSEQKRYILKPEFLKTQKYDMIVQGCRNYEDLLKKWASLICSSYRGNGNPSTIVKIFPPSVEGITEILCEGISSFINSEVAIAQEHLTFIDEIGGSSKLDQMIRLSQHIKDQTEKLQSLLIKQQKKNYELVMAEKLIKAGNSDKIENFLSSKWTSRLRAIEKLIKDKSVQAITPQQSSQYSLMFHLSEEIQQNAFKYRKMLLDLKYGVLKKGVKSSRQLLQCFAEYLSVGSMILKRILGKTKVEFGQLTRTSLGSSSVGTGAYVEELSEGYSQSMRLYLASLENLKQMFSCDFSHTQLEMLVKILKEVYAGNQDLTSQMIESLSLFEIFAEQRLKYQRRIDQVITGIRQLRKNSRKSVDILIALAKKRQNIPLQGENPRESYEENLIDRDLSLERIEVQIVRLIEFFAKSYESLGQKCLKIKKKALEPINTSENFEISFDFRQIQIKNKRPNKLETWLWKDWRDFNFSHLFQSQFSLKDLQKSKKMIKELLSEEEEIQNISCFIFLERQYKVRLTVTKNKVVIQDKKGQFDLIVPVGEIRTCEERNKQLVIFFKRKTSLVLYKLDHIEGVKAKINEAIQKPKSAGKKMKLFRPKLTEEQKRSIEERKQMVEKQRQNIDEYTKYEQKLLAGCSIQDVYEYIFSDSNSCPLNKGQFFQYISIKLKNQNYTEGKYDKPGPAYYTGNKEISFMNCPIFSQRKSSLYHPLPPIPFIPKGCQCSQTDKIYWISDKQLDYKTEVLQSGASMMESFYTNTLYRVKEIEQGAQVKVFAKITFVKDTRLKSVLKSGAQGEMKEILPFIVKQMEKCMKVGAASAGNNEEEEEITQASPVTKHEQITTAAAGDSSDSKQSLTKLIISLLLGLLLLNVAIWKVIL